MDTVCWRVRRACAEAKEFEGEAAERQRRRQWQRRGETCELETMGVDKRGAGNEDCTRHFAKEDGGEEGGLALKEGRFLFWGALWSIVGRSGQGNSDEVDVVEARMFEVAMHQR